jgi:predicted phage baseplate assembly protein
VMKSSYPFVGRVENRREARGGVDAETIENAKERGPIRLRTRGRAVTAEDYEELAREAAPQIGRVKAVAAGEGAAAGWVRVLAVPSVSTDRPLEFGELKPDPTVLKTIRDHLEERRVLGIQLNVESVRYQGARVETTLKPAAWAAPNTVRKDVAAALNRYLHPTVGGPDGRGWPFGRPVTIGELYSVVQRVPGVELVEKLELFKVNADNGSKREAMSRVEVSAHSLVFGRDHTVTVAGADAAEA